MASRRPPTPGPSKAEPKPTRPIEKTLEQTAASAPAKTTRTSTNTSTSTKKTTAKAPRPTEVTEDMRRSMIAQAAYLRAERRRFTAGDEVEDWLAAEAEVDALLKSGGTPQ
jgi:hypothetical protein